MNKDSGTGHTSMTNPTDLVAPIADYHRLASHAECLSVDMVLQIATLATAIENLRVTHANSLKIIQDVERLLRDRSC